MLNGPVWVRPVGVYTRRTVSALGVVLALLVLAFMVVTPAAFATEGSDGNKGPAGDGNSSLGEQKCGVEVTPQAPTPRQVNLVLDDSGSMFSDGTTTIDRWSNAKYSLEVFAAMLGPQDVLNVYRTSDFVDGKTSGAATTVLGSSPIEERIATIHRLDMIGGGTPYAPVAAAVSDLAASDFEEKWLVVVSDGAFEGVADEQVQADMERFSAEHTTDESNMNVAFLAIGDEAPALTSNPGAGVYFQQAEETAELLAVMTGFSNRIFARSEIAGTGGGGDTWGIAPDTELEELLVFAQGPDVEVGELTSGGVVLEPSSRAAVSWVENPMSELTAVPNKDLTGMLATFTNVPAGDATVDISGAHIVDFFYKPRVSFGIVLRDTNGSVVEADRIVGGDYTVEFGFMDSDCNFVQSNLLGDVTYSAQALQNGEVVAEDISPSDTITLERGDAQFRVSASYLNDNVTEAVVDVTVLRPSQPTVFRLEPKIFQASHLEDYKMPQDAMVIHYGMDQDGTLVEFSEDEWNSFTGDSFTVTSDKNIDFEVEVGDVGTVYLIPRAPDGVPIDASTGQVPFTISAQHVYDEQPVAGALDAEVTIEDDFSFWQRALHWMMTQGWKWLLLLLALIVIYGYIRRPRLPRKLQKSPMVDFRPKNLSMRPTQSAGKVTKSMLPKFVPFMADTAQIRYVPPGTAGFRALKVKAVKGGRMRVVNWRNIANQGNVEFDGDLLTKESKKARTLGGSSNITATAIDGVYSCQLGTPRKGKGT